MIQRGHDTQVGQPQILIFYQLCGRLDDLAETSFQQMLASIQTENGLQVELINHAIN